MALHITYNTKNVIYMVQCNRCNLQYIGETKRRLKDRFNEHRRAVMYGQVAPSVVDRIVQSTKLTLNLNPQGRIQDFF